MRETIDHAKHLCRLAVVPYEENDYRPHLLHPERTTRYIAAFSVMKLIILGLVVLLPAGIFAAPEAVEMQEQELIALVNEERVAGGAPSLALDARLMASSRAKSEDMFARQYFAHVNADGEGPDAFATRAGYPFSVVGENLAMGFVSARDVVAAWRQSPTHARNIRDALYEDTGLAVIGGTYHGQPTMFIAQHFGRERAGTAGALASPEQISATTLGSENAGTPDAPAETPTVRAAALEWTAREDGSTAVSATAEIEGPVAEVRVRVHGSDIALRPKPDAPPNTFAGIADIPAAPEEVFRVLVPATLTVTSTAGSTVDHAVPWEDPVVIAPSFVQKYEQAKALLPQTFGPSYRFSRIIFAIAFIIFALAWIINLVVEIRRQHLDLLIPGGALVLLLGAFWLI